MSLATPIHERDFYHDGRGPELQRVRWKHNGVILHGFEFYNPGDVYEVANLKHLILHKVEAHAMAGEEVHGDIRATAQSKAAIFRIEESPWKRSFQQSHLKSCHHFQIMFYDEIYDVICESISFGSGKLQKQQAVEQGSAH